MFNDHLASGHWAHAAASGCVTAAPVAFVLLVGVAWWTARGRHPVVVAAALWAPLGVVAAFLANQPIEQQPEVRLPFFAGLASRTADLPAPSDHAAMAAATAAGLFLVNRGIGLVAAAAWAVMTTALVAGGAAVQDVATGTIVGAIVTLIGFVLVEGPLRRLVAWSRRTRAQRAAGGGS